jgi:hypothetical protein
MGTNVILLGELRFPPRKLRAWHHAEIDVGAFDDWLDEYRKASEPTTPHAILTTLARPEVALGDLEITGTSVVLRLLLGEDQHRDVCAPLAAVFRAARAHGGSGELTSVEWEGEYGHRIVVSPEGSSLRRVRGKALAGLAARPEHLELARRPRKVESAAEAAARKVWSQPATAPAPPKKKERPRTKPEGGDAPEVDASGLLDPARAAATLGALVTTAPTAAYDAMSPTVEALFRGGPKARAASEKLGGVLDLLQAQAYQMRKSKRFAPILRADPRWTDLGLRVLEAHRFGATPSLPVVSALRALGERADPRVVPAIIDKLPAAGWELHVLCETLRALGDAASLAPLEAELATRRTESEARALLAFTIEEIRAAEKRRAKAAKRG